jgi:hypothetical protein
VTRVTPVRRRLALITPVRIGLGLALLGVALGGHAPARSVALAFLVGTVFMALAALADRRALLLRPPAEPKPLPSDSLPEADWRIALEAALPSTVGVGVLGAVAVAAGNEVLGALLAGGVAGMGVASAASLIPLFAWERERGERLYAGRGGCRFVA